MIRKLARGAVLPALALGAMLAPVRFSATEPPAAARAECTTCCTNAGSLCVVCARNCLVVENSYDIGPGACPP